MPTVYIKTSIPSYYHETRRDARSVAWRDATRVWWDRHRTRFELCTSILTLNELAAAPAHKSRPALGMLRGVRVLAELPQTADVIAYYVQHQLMPTDAAGDAGHLAFASLHRIDFLLTWNCRHLANANKTKHIEVLNARLGLSVPVLTTPWTLMPEDSNDAENKSQD